MFVEAKLGAILENLFAYYLIIIIYALLWTKLKVLLLFLRQKVEKFWLRLLFPRIFIRVKNDILKADLTIFDHWFKLPFLKIEMIKQVTEFWSNWVYVFHYKVPKHFLSESQLHIIREALSNHLPSKFLHSV